MYKSQPCYHLISWFVLPSKGCVFKPMKVISCIVIRLALNHMHDFRASVTVFLHCQEVSQMPR